MEIGPISTSVPHTGVTYFPLNQYRPQYMEKPLILPGASNRVLAGQPANRLECRKGGGAGSKKCQFQQLTVCWLVSPRIGESVRKGGGEYEVVQNEFRYPI
jgi:hypothetical protein